MNSAHPPAVKKKTKTKPTNQTVLSSLPESNADFRVNADALPTLQEVNFHTGLHQI